MSNGRWKTVDYWTARVVGSDDVGRYRPNDEIDAVEWVPWKEAERRLTYPYDRDTLAEARPLRRKTRTLVVLRHGKARSRSAWRQDDRLRPLLQLGAGPGPAPGAAAGGLRRDVGAQLVEHSAACRR